MQRMIGFAAIASVMSIAGGRPGPLTAVANIPASAATAAPQAPVDLEALLAAAHGAPPMICALAARSIGNGRWGRWAECTRNAVGLGRGRG